MSDHSEPAPKKTAPRAASTKKPTSTQIAEADALPFEASLEKLEAIVESLENGDVALADLLSRYEEASGLLKNCQQQLDAAQLRIERLTRKDGQDVLEPFAPEA